MLDAVILALELYQNCGITEIYNWTLLQMYSICKCIFYYCSMLSNILVIRSSFRTITLDNQVLILWKGKKKLIIPFPNGLKAETVLKSLYNKHTLIYQHRRIYLLQETLKENVFNSPILNYYSKHHKPTIYISIIQKDL